MNNSRMIWFGRYEGWLRMVARGVRDGDKECIRKAAQLFDVMLPYKCVVIPMPSHNGRAKRMMEVASMLSEMKKGRIVVDALECMPHDSNYAQKKDGFVPCQILMWVRDDNNCRRLLRKDDALKDLPVFVIDNVICSGVTASASLNALRDVALDTTVCTLAYSTWR